MNAFEFQFTLYGLLLGLALVEVISGFSRAVDARAERPLGVITPLLAIVLVLDIVTWWGSAWRDDRNLEFSTRYLLWVAFTMMIYYFATTQLFARERGAAASLDEHFFRHRWASVGGVLAANVLTVADSLWRHVARDGVDTVFWTRAGANALWFATILVILLSRSKRAVVAALGVNIVFILYWLVR